MYSSAAVIVRFCLGGVPVYKGISMVLSLFRSHSWLVVVYCLVFCSGSCEPVHLDRTNSCSKEHYVCVYSSFLMWKKRNSWSIGNIDRSMCCYCKNPFCQGTFAMIDIPFQVGITNNTPFIENSSGVFPRLERRIYAHILSVAASALLLRSIFPFEFILRAARVL